MFVIVHNIGMIIPLLIGLKFNPINGIVSIHIHKIKHSNVYYCVFLVQTSE